MNTDRLEHFLTLCKTKNMSKAAEQLYISQPALSLSISALEEELGFPLFSRDHKKLTLNRQGQVAQQYAEEILQRVNDMKTAVNNCATEFSPLRMCTDVYAMYTYITAQYLKSYPEQGIEYLSVPENTYLSQLLNQNVDVCITTFPLNHADIMCNLLCDIVQFVIVPRDSPFYGKGELPLQSYEGLSFYRNKDYLHHSSIYVGKFDEHFTERIHIKASYLDWNILRMLWEDTDRYLFSSSLCYCMEPALQQLDHRRFVMISDAPKQHFWLSASRSLLPKTSLFIEWCGHTAVLPFNPKQLQIF